LEVIAAKAGLRGVDLESQHKYDEAISHYEVAIKGGQGGFASRGGCLAKLGWHYDAIDDFTREINLFPGDPNNYFMRSQSKYAVGDASAIDDLKTAIKLSKDGSIVSNQNNENARMLGFTSATSIY
jgi:tetratricopeptide (TPR) repeat protein